MLLPLVAFLAAQSADIPIVSGLGISGVSSGGRAPTGVDAVQSLIVEGKWMEPHAGDKIVAVRGERIWTEVKANKDGVFEGGPTQGGYIYASVESDVEKPMLLQAAGDSMVYINGEPRGGDPYSYGYLRLPFLMKKGPNTFLFSCGRGRLQAKLSEPKARGFFNVDDMTVPDVLPSDSGEMYGGIPVVNATASRRYFMINAVARGESGGATAIYASQVIVEPFSIRKGIFAFRRNPKEGGEVKVELSLRDGTDMSGKSQPELDRQVITLSGRQPTDHYRRTFLSDIDGSVQYFAVAPSLKPDKSNALVLTVHGASVEATGQANAYKSKDWCTIVAATNRRPYGFDWEDWGRMDAMEVWNLAKKEFPHDPQRQILTGHSMGGHGTWQIGLTYPNEFAAIGPSAGWISFWSYAGGWEPKDPSPVEQILRRSANQSDTLLMQRNALNEDVFILHGDKDDNVPVEQAREMKKRLEGLGVVFDESVGARASRPLNATGTVALRHEYIYHEEPGAGHWWGDQCVDWPPMFEMFAQARLGRAGAGPADRFEFTTVNPAVSSTYRGFTIEQQIEPLKPSRLVVQGDKTGWHITTENVARFVIPDTVAASKEVFINGQEIRNDSDEHHKLPQAQRTYTLAYDPAGSLAGVWSSYVKPGDKSSSRSGPFKLAFQNRFALVVGTHGTADENRWAANKARFDAEQWYYRGNGSVEIITDELALGHRLDPKDFYNNRNLILYGNADTNSAFQLLKGCPLQVKRGRLTIGDHRLGGSDAVALYLWPEGKRLIGVVGGTGLTAFRLADRLPYFTSGVAYPDWTIMRSSVLKEGTKRVIGAGFFGNDWKFDPKQSAFLNE